MSDLKGYSIGEAIRLYLLHGGEGYCYGFWKIWRHVNAKSSYKSVMNYFWILKELGLIEFVSERKGEGNFNRRLYRVVPGMETADAWKNPAKSLYPITGLGDKYYKLLEKGLKPKGGRRPKYARA